MTLPTGEVTFCFTDIEGSTRLAQRLGPTGYAHALDQHRQVLRGVWRAHNGVEVSTEGDAFFVVFDDSANAIAAAAAAQPALDAAAWAFDGRVAVRVGLHRGRAEIADDNYVGLEVNRAARIASAGHGGQVVMSEPVAAHVADESRTDLGWHRLKGFDEPQRIWQFAGADFPPLRAAPAMTHNLPLLRTSLIGRDDDLDALAKRVQEHRLVTIIGTGGAGKTRVALELARRYGSRYADGVWLAFLASTTDDARVADAVASALEVQDSSAEPSEAITRHLGDTSALIILDNCEQVVTGVAQLVNTVLAQNPEIRVVATSRRPLQIAGENVWALPELSLPSAAASPVALLESAAGQLFLDRARAANPRFELTHDNADAVTAICRGVNGIPLALELAASTSRAVPLAALAERIETTTGLLRAGSRSDEPRQQNIEALVGWSYELLNDRQQAAFRRFSVFRGGASFDAAEAVCSDSASLADLVDHSLLQLDDDGRYRMLVLVRGFAQDRLAEHDELTPTAAAHFAWCVDWCASFAPEPVDRASLARIEAEVDNLSAAFAFGLGQQRFAECRTIAERLGQLWLNRGRYRAARAMFEPLAVADDPAVAVFATVLLAQVAWNQGDALGAIETGTHAAALAVVHGDTDQAAAALRTVAYAQMIRGEATAARAALDEALALRPSGIVAVTLERMNGELAAQEGDNAAAERAFRAVYEMYVRQGERHRATRTLISLGIAVHHQNRLEEGDDLFSSAVELATADDLPSTVGYALFNRAVLRLDQSRFGDALDDAREARAVFLGLGEPLPATRVLDHASRALIGLGDAAAAANETIVELEEAAWLDDRVALTEALATAQVILASAETVAPDDLVGISRVTAALHRVARGG